MARGPKKHLKRLAAPHHWMLSKLGGKFAPRPSQGPHKLRECVPLVVLLRNRLKYALNYNESTKILMQRLIKVDGKIRTDKKFPAGFMDVISIEKTGEFFRMVYDTKGRFKVHPISKDEAAYKLCKVRFLTTALKAVPYIVTHDGRTIRYPHPEVRRNDTVMVEIATGKVIKFIKFEMGKLCMITGGANIGRVGVMQRREKLEGAIDIVHVKDAIGNSFSTRITNVFVIGEEKAPWISLPKLKGIRRTIMEERNWRLEKSASQK
ncbi:small ribosomal subunit protein eS4-like [Symsagittifera roscoffensis]|uniref:small ribosomal subunit protein eS4-like n=1 Tax=Symsagittifera roscoffensis TaxID=84072 RepID=UPI00307B7E94